MKIVIIDGKRIPVIDMNKQSDDELLASLRARFGGKRVQGFEEG